jgi:hypothetical protein
MFIKLGPKHASKDEIELAIVEVLGEFRLSVRDLGLLLAVLGSKLQLVVPSSVHSIGYSVHASKQTINTSEQIYRLSSRREKGEYISSKGEMVNGSVEIIPGKVW